MRPTPQSQHQTKCTCLFTHSEHLHTEAPVPRNAGGTFEARLINVRPDLLLDVVTDVFHHNEIFLGRVVVLRSDTHLGKHTTQRSNSANNLGRDGGSSEPLRDVWFPARHDRANELHLEDSPRRAPLVQYVK